MCNSAASMASATSPPGPATRPIVDLRRDADGAAPDAAGQPAITFAVGLVRRAGQVVRRAMRPTPISTPHTGSTLHARRSRCWDAGGRDPGVTPQSLMPSHKQFGVGLADDPRVEDAGQGGQGCS